MVDGVARVQSLPPRRPITGKRSTLEWFFEARRRSGGVGRPMSTLAKMRFAASLTVVMFVVMIAAPSMAMAAQATVDLGTTASFAVLGGSLVTNTGSSVISGDLGIYPGSGSVPHSTGFPPGVVGPPGTVHDADAVATQAQTDLVTAYNESGHEGSDRHGPGRADAHTWCLLLQLVGSVDR
jgi:hypothetical protein